MSMHRYPPPGTILLGKYRVEGIIGEGGMGAVVKAQHIDLDEPVAIKVLLPELVERADIVTRFLREARAAVKLKGAHVARVLDVGRLENGIPYIVMEHLEGADLNAIVKHYGPQAPQLATDLVLQACDGLAEAHSLGIIHRDIKASNLFVTHPADHPPSLKILDFGIATAPEGASDLTSTTSVMGTPAYMAPEQMRSTRTADARSDIWSLGVVLYELLEGVRPYRAEAYSELCIAVAMDPPVAMVRPMPPGLVAVVMKCLEKPIERRYQTVADLALDLVPFASDPARARMLAERCTSFALRRPTMANIPRPAPAAPGETTPVPKTPPPMGAQSASYSQRYVLPGSQPGPAPSSQAGVPTGVLHPRPPYDAPTTADLPPEVVAAQSFQRAPFAGHGPRTPTSNPALPASTVALPTSNPSLRVSNPPTSPSQVHARAQGIPQLSLLQPPTVLGYPTPPLDAGIKTPTSLHAGHGQVVGATLALVPPTAPRKRGLMIAASALLVIVVVGGGNGLATHGGGATPGADRHPAAGALSPAGAGTADTESPTPVETTPAAMTPPVHVTPAVVAAPAVVATPDPVVVKADPKVVKTVPAIVKTDPAIVKADPKAVKADPKAVKTDPKRGKSDPKTGKTEPKTGKPVGTKPPAGCDPNDLFGCR